MSEATARILELTADAAASGQRLDVFLAQRYADLSRSYIQRLIEKGLVLVDGRPARRSHRVRAGEAIVVRVPPPAPVDLQPEALPLRVVYEDDDLLVVDKPPGMPVHPAPGHSGGTLVNAVLARSPDLSGVGGELRPGIVHRLDKDTSGLIIVAKNDFAHTSLSWQLKARRVHKVYLALVEGRLEPPEGEIDAPIARHPRHRKKMAVVPGGREAVTRYRVLRYYEGAKGDASTTSPERGHRGYTLIEAMPVTGRTHQIRVHMAHSGHPIVGDATYGRKSPLVARQFLHAHRLGFILPSTARYAEFESPLPEDLEGVLIKIRTAAE